MTRTLVSGGTGLVGRFIVEGLAQAGHQVTVLGRTPPAPGFFCAPVRFVAGALDPGRDQRRAFAGIDGFVHAAFDHAPGRYRGGEGDDPAGFRRRNHDGSIALFQAARCMGVHRAVFLSSRAAVAADTLYGEVKRLTEGVLRAMSGAEFHTASLRATGVYGPAGPGRDHKWSALFRDYLAGSRVPPRAGTEVHGEDVAAAVRLFLEAQDVAGWTAPLNVSDISLDRRDLLAIVRQVTGSRHPLPEPADPPAVAFPSETLRSLGWDPGGWPLFETTVRRLAREPSGEVDAGR